eukprot:CAMPEP_0175993502 /NCGR_PEP_ID=MMETSP0108-20121206/54004_1 /TAXON_ID=195067 ORGANISM="Goniomonas pacifica, Strain CCMP1869" /NCGR_SAMPLE_ID=MMETSP0108 /ASSEMBLY_ACC=CAM_ASM_000204 /LENGTH=32 /DNA_ID= /DNA_START= /DNA_END= /DNA_ORIENTATION=
MGCGDTASGSFTATCATSGSMQSSPSSLVTTS